MGFDGIQHLLYPGQTHILWLCVRYGTSLGKGYIGEAAQVEVFGVIQGIALFGFGIANGRIPKTGHADLLSYLDEKCFQTNGLAGSSALNTRLDNRPA